MTSFRRSQLALSLFVWAMPVCWFSLPQGEDTSVINPHDLRSAFLLRERVVNYHGRTVAEHQVELRRHFDAVLAILELNTPNAIELALDRLEKSHGEAWSIVERANHRDELLAGRELQLARLRAYRDHGLFPQNEGHANHAVPIFVDNHDTVCAVGHLMRLAGWKAEVAGIQAANNLVYVPDAADSSVAEWALTAGVTLEEAALIQPGYPYDTEYLLRDYADPGEVLVKNGLMYSNFQLQVQNYEFSAELPQSLCDQFPFLAGCALGTGPLVTSDTGPKPSFEEIGFLVGEGPYELEDCCLGFTPNGSHWIVIGGYEPTGPPFYDSYDRFINGYAPLHRAQKLLLRFDVSPVQAGAMIDGIGHGSYYFTYGLSVPIFDEPPQVDYSMTTRAIVGGSTLASVTMNYDPNRPDHPPYTASTGFAPQSSITVETEIWLQYEARVGSIRMDFNVIGVPEPSTLSLLAFAGVFGLSTLLRRFIRC